MKNKIVLTILILSMIALVFTGCDGNPVVPPTNICDSVDKELSKIIEELNLSDDLRFYYYTHFYSDCYDLKDALDKEIDPQEIPGLTYRTFILNALYEEKLVNNSYPAFVEDASDSFIKLADNLSNWEENFAILTTKLAILGAIQALGMPTLGIGISSLFLVIELLEIKPVIADLEKLFYDGALSRYLRWRASDYPLHDHESAWENSGIPLGWSTGKKLATENFFKYLWKKYEGAITNNNLNSFKEEQHEMLRELILQALNQPPNPPTNMIQFKSDGKTILKIGETTNERTVILKAKISDPDGDKVKLQIELRRLDEYGGQFDEDAGGLKQSDLLENNSEVIIPVYGLSDGHYHWRARAIDEYGLSSEWVSFGANPDSAVDFTVLPTSLLTATEIELIRKWGFGGDYVVRWPNGYVDVYDATNYSRMQEIINEWNTVIGGPAILRLNNNPNSQVKVYYKLIFGYCGNRDVKWNEDYTFSTIDIQISDNTAFCGYPSTKYALYLFMFKNVAGFKGWTTKGEDVPYEEWTNFTEINDTMKKMVKALYKVPPGYYLGDTKQRKDHSNVIIKNISTSEGLNCLDNGKK